MRRIIKHFQAALKHLDASRKKELAKATSPSTQLGESFATAVEDDERARWEGLQYEESLRQVSEWLSSSK
jgi:hypothetical protein